MSKIQELYFAVGLDLLLLTHKFLTQPVGHCISSLASDDFIVQKRSIFFIMHTRE